ncbi:MAG TPA: nuclear transport factor 2 family protein [Rubrobacteraceae bacterium]|nr:nuclear transport factor 2 family protein [Rubrobacteraceae bacterium]
MSRENIEIVRKGLAAYSRRDVENFLSYLDPGIEFHSAVVGGAEGSVYLGHEGVRKWIADSDESFDEITTDLSEYRDLGDRVLAFGRIRARGRESGLELDSETGWVFTLRDGKLVKTEGFLSRAEALEAAGLSE